MGGFRAMKTASPRPIDARADGSDSQKAEYLIATGQVGSATITAIRQTGTMVNYNPVRPRPPGHGQQLGGASGDAPPGHRPGRPCELPARRDGPVRVDPADRSL
jgi:hypothetical protein